MNTQRCIGHTLPEPPYAYTLSAAPLTSGGRGDAGSGMSQQPWPRWWPPTHPHQQSPQEGRAETPSFSPSSHLPRGEELGAGGIWGLGHLGPTLPIRESGSAPLPWCWQVTLPCTWSPEISQKRGHTWGWSTTKNKQEAQGFRFLLSQPQECSGWLCGGRRRWGRTRLSHRNPDS